jgi:hypothetical protein
VAGKLETSYLGVLAFLFVVILLEGLFVAVSVRLTSHHF